MARRPPVPITPPAIRVAEYIRMSTERQEYSPTNQLAAIHRYADAHGMTVVRTYQDLGKSGLAVDGREALQRLLRDVQNGHPGYEAVLVLDVTRWGRFQNADESAFYEYLCLRHGVRVIYVAETFTDDPTPLGALVKSLKRSMAAEYSRELSDKVFAGQCRIVRAGFRMGGPPGYGLRRMLVDGQGRQKGILRPGERKSLITDHTTIVLGPPEEVRVVRWIFRQSAAGIPNNDIARRLNAKGVLNSNGRSWSWNGVREMLDDERYIGTLVFARSTKAIGQTRGRTPDREVRVPQAFPGLVDPALFRRAKATRAARNRKLTDAELLDALRNLWHRKGRITSALLASDNVSPTAQVYLRRFGSLRAAYRMIGYDQVRDLAYGDLRDRIRPWRKTLLYALAEWLEDDGSQVDLDGWVLRIDKAWTVSVRLLQAGPYKGRVRWEVRPTRRSVDLLVAARMAEDGTAPLDYLILPRVMADRWPTWITQRPQAAVRFFTFPSLNIVRELARISRRAGPHVSQ